jgi:hypothetical protein
MQIAARSNDTFPSQTTIGKRNEPMRNDTIVVHHIPGRIRFKVPGAKGDHVFFRQIHEIAASVDGVHNAAVSPVTASVTVGYDRNDPAIWQRLNKAFKQQGVLLALALPELGEAQTVSEIAEEDASLLAGRSRTVSALLRTMHALDRALKRATGNVIDLRRLLTLTLVGISLFSMVKRKDPIMLILLPLLAVHALLSLSQPDMPAVRRVR